MRDRKEGYAIAGEAGVISRFLQIKSEVLSARLMALFVESITIRKSRGNGDSRSLASWRLRKSQFLGTDDCALRR